MTEVIVITMTDPDAKALLDKWEEIKVLVESIDLDLRKNAIKANHSAGLRARRGLRLLKKTTHDLLMTSINVAKKRQAEKG